MDMLEESLEISQDEVVHMKEEIDEGKHDVNNANLTIIEEDNSMSDDQTVDSLAHAQAILDGEDVDDVTYQWKSDNGVTYRVYHVNPEDQEGESEASDFQTGGAHIQPVVLTSNLGSNHFYVVGNDVLAAQPSRSLAPRSNVVIENRSTPPPSAPRIRRDDRRRATHNEVERRRRDKINNWIQKLSKIIPDCAALDNSRSAQSKGCILAKACEYILELRNSNEKIMELQKANEKLANHVEYLQTMNEKLKVENNVLRQRTDRRQDS